MLWPFLWRSLSSATSSRPRPHQGVMMEVYATPTGSLRNRAGARTSQSSDLTGYRYLVFRVPQRFAQTTSGDQPTASPGATSVETFIAVVMSWTAVAPWSNACGFPRGNGLRVSARVERCISSRERDVRATTWNARDSGLVAGESAKLPCCLRALSRGRFEKSAGAWLYVCQLALAGA